MTEPSNTFGYGQQGPNTSTSPFNVFSFIVSQALAQVRTIVPVEIMEVENEGGVAPTGTVAARPLVNMLDGQNNATPHETIYGLIYFRLQGGANAVIIDPQVGDIGLAAICDRDISSLKVSKAQANPGSGRQFALPDGVYIGGVLNGAPTQYVRFSDEGIEIKSASQVTIDAPTVNVSGNLVVEGTVTGAGLNLNTHHHLSTTPGTPTGAPIP